MNLLKKGQDPYGELREIKEPVLVEVNRKDDSHYMMFIVYPNGRVEDTVFFFETDINSMCWDESRFSIKGFEKLLNFFNVSDYAKLRKTICSMEDNFNLRNMEIVGIYKM